MSRQPTAGGASAWANAASTVTTLPAAPSNLMLTAPDVDSVALQWTDNSHGATGYKVERNDNAGSGWVQIALLSSTATSYTDVTVNEATTYSYRVRTASNSLNSPYSNSPSITTVPLDPDTMAATTISTSEIDLSWNNNSAGATSNLIERSDDGGSTFTQIASVSGTASTYNDTGLTEGFTYQYRVRAQDAGGFSGYTDSVQATTLPGRPQQSGRHAQAAGHIAAVGSTTPAVKPATPCSVTTAEHGPQLPPSSPTRTASATPAPPADWSAGKCINTESSAPTTAATPPSPASRPPRLDRSKPFTIRSEAKGPLPRKRGGLLLLASRQSKGWSYSETLSGASHAGNDLNMRFLPESGGVGVDRRPVDPKSGAR